MRTRAAIVFFLSLLFAFPFSISAGEGEAVQSDWLYNIDNAKAKAAANDLPILVSFSGSDWCLPCMRLERDLFGTPDFIDYSSENLVLLKLDFPARKKNALSEEQVKHNEALAEIYNLKGAFPLVVIIDGDGNVRGQMAHPLTSTEAYIQSIESVIHPK